MFSTWDRNHAAADRWVREAAHTRRRADPMDDFVKSIDVMIGIAGAAFAACVLAIVLL